MDEVQFMEARLRIMTTNMHHFISHAKRPYHFTAYGYSVYHCIAYGHMGIYMTLQGSVFVNVTKDGMVPGPTAPNCQGDAGPSPLQLLQDPGEFAATFERKGVSADRPVVVSGRDFWLWLCGVSPGRGKRARCVPKPGVCRGAVVLDSSPALVLR